MRTAVSRISLFVAAACLMGGQTLSATPPESAATALSLLVSPSTRVNGMGEAGVALTDEPSGHYNPAALAFTARDWNFSTTNYVGKMDWLPGLADSMTYSYNSFSIGGERRLGEFGQNTAPVPFSVSGAFGYYRTKMDLGNVLSSDDGKYHRSFESVNSFMFSGSARFIAEIGAGAAVKRVDQDNPAIGCFGSNRNEDATAFDLGVLGKLPFVDLAEFSVGKKLEWHGFRPELSASAGAAWNNLGGKVKRPDGYKDPLPRNFTHGYAGTAGFSYHAGGASLNILRYTVVRETYVPEVDGKTYADSCNDKKRGWELSFFDTYAIREGSYDDDDGALHYDTRGWTVSSDGLFELISAYRGDRGENDYIGYVLSHTSVNWSRFTYSSGYDDMENSQLTILFRM